MPRKTILLAVSAVVCLFAACKKETKFKYKATCNQCRISYYDEAGNFVDKEPHTGTFEKEISVPQFSPVMLAVQSTAYPDSATNSPIFLTDVVMTELVREGETICSDTSEGGKKFQAASCSYTWEK